jgi:hypothetical protein
MKLVTAALVVFCLTSCSAHHSQSMFDQSMRKLKLKQEHTVRRHSDWVMSQRSPVAMALPPSSAQHPRASLAFERALKKHGGAIFPRLMPLESVLSLEDASVMAFAKGCSLLIYPRLHSSENRRDDRNEIFEGKTAHHDRKLGRDSTQIELLIIDTYSLDVLDSVFVNSTAAMFKNPDEQALDLLDQAVANALTSLVPEA